MAVRLIEKSPSELLNINDVQIYVGQADVKKTNHDGLTLIVLNSQNTVDTVLTRNRFYTVSIYIAKSRLFDEGGVRTLVINTGNANVGTDARGRTNTVEVYKAAARQVGYRPSQILPFSTDMILESLPVQGIIGVPPNVEPVHWSDAARVIMTTDTASKAVSRRGKVGEKRTIRAAGIAKGLGMIHPNMAIMLIFVAANAKVSQPVLQSLTQEATNATFNIITVDGDTNTNDSSVIIATGKYGQMGINNTVDPRYGQLKKLLGGITLELAQAIVRDDGGAGKFIIIHAERATDREEACKVTYAVARSPLVKTAFFAGDSNLDCLLTATGYAGIAGLDVGRIRMWLGDVLVAEHGGHVESYTEKQGQAVVDEDEITVRIDLQRSKAGATACTCDLTHEHISVNADYRS